jgi:hypothetical protein
MSIQGALKIVGTVVVTFVAWHFLNIWGLLLGCGVAMIVLP